MTTDGLSKYIDVAAEDDVDEEEECEESDDGSDDSFIVPDSEDDEPRRKRLRFEECGFGTEQKIVQLAVDGVQRSVQQHFETTMKREMAALREELQLLRQLMQSGFAGMKRYHEEQKVSNGKQAVATACVTPRVLGDCATASLRSGASTTQMGTDA